ncbi:MAG: DUF2220 family protein [Aromatoleum sp.]|jgi:hypothetical protein|uniref:Wadjet anti-phage system protein JetD domain-containing protein n=1 Tax=Aromatoleum sp. TaxID=2307007 RepID=UPI0028954FC6|nr:Wadjet anti-phage system protein JetD domain-containing protein [Aromatoleum sp.]MDT3672958.1 DUF2220 family protein [Aromatoleum sp.]
MSDAFLEALRTGTRKRISLDDVRRAFFAAHPEVLTNPGRSALLLERLRALEEAGALVLPAAGSWEKVGNPPLPTWVQVTRDPALVSAVDYAAVPWVPELGFWPELKPPALEAARTINDFLLRRRTTLTMVPIKERSLEIFGDEKRLDALRASGDNSLFGGRLPLSALGAFVVPSPLPYRLADAAGQPVLVVENHNSFWSFGEWNQQARRYAAVVYGSGKAFQGSGNALEQVLHEVGGVGALYLGDLDPAGVRIPLEFNLTRGDGYTPVRPAVELYRWLLENGRRRPLEERQERAGHIARNWLGAELGGELTALWDAGQWVPQESLGFERLTAGAGAFPPS